MSRVALLVLALAACGGDDGDAPAIDAARSDAASVDGGDTDAAPDTDAAIIDGSSIDAATNDAAIVDGMVIDAMAIDAAVIDAPMIDAVPPTSDHHIHIYVSNTCVMTVSPLEITIPAGQTAYFDWHNHSVDYAVDVWMSYGGGYLDLPTGATWNEPIGHCATPSVHVEYADISTACSDFRFLIRCN